MVAVEGGVQNDIWREDESRTFMFFSTRTMFVEDVPSLRRAAAGGGGDSNSDAANSPPFYGITVPTKF
jgi:hypothetical protein